MLPKAFADSEYNAAVCCRLSIPDLWSSLAVWQQ